MRLLNVRKSWRSSPWIAAWSILAVSLGMTAAAAGMTATTLSERDGVRFQHVVQVTQARIEARLEMYLTLLRATAGLHASLGKAFTREAFHVYAERAELEQRYPGIQGIGFSKVVRPDEREAIVASMRRREPEFRVWPDDARARVTSILFLEPRDARNRAALGYDMFSDPVRREAMWQAWRTGRPTLSGRVILKQEITGPKQAGFLLYLPVYRGGGTPRTERMRIEQLDGFVYSPFRAGDFFTEIFASERASHGSFRVYDGAVRSDNLLFETDARDSKYPSRFRATVPLTVAGRTWTLDIRSTPAFESLRPAEATSAIGFAGLFVSLLLFKLAHAQASARLRAEQSSARGRFLLRVEDTLRVLSEPAAIVSASARLLCEHLLADRCAFAEVSEAQDCFRVTGAHGPMLPDADERRFPLAAFGEETLRALRDDAPIVIDDVARDPRLIESAREMYDRVHARAAIYVPLLKENRLMASLSVHQAAPRAWRDEEVELVRSVASRCWESIERARSEKSLRESEERFRNMADHAPVLLWMTDSAGRCTYLNRPWYEFTGQTPESALGSGFVRALAPQDTARMAKTLDGARRDHAATSQEYRLRRHDGTLRWVLEVAVPRFDVRGEYLGHIGSIVDISERKRAEEESERLLARAEEAVKVRDDFLSVASHELKTPIAALTLQTHSLRRLTQRLEGPNSQKIESKVGAVERQMERLTALVEELLDVSRISSGRLEVFPQPVDLASLLRGVLARASPGLERAGCVLKVDVPPALEARVDPMRMEQIADNLLENARKYGAGRPIEVGLTEVEGKARFVVRDHGIGIAPHDQSRIFERFERAVPSKHYGGLGLGLWITRQVTEAMGGSIHVESRVGEGAMFEVWLPGMQAS